MIPYVRQHWARLLVSPSGTFASGVPLRLLAFGLVATAAWLANRVTARVQLPVAMYEVAGAVIALVLAFRTNTAYARFWEGRTLWGAVVNSCRNLARIVERHSRAEPAEVREYAVWIVAFAHGMRRVLRGEQSYPELEGLLPPQDLERFVHAPHPALCAADELSRRLAELVARGALAPILAAEAEREIVALVNSLGGCERIHKTPTPLGYVLLIQRFIAVYLASLPFAMLNRVGALTPIVTLAVAYPVLLIEALANELDDPFGHHPNDLPLTRICSTIQFNLLGFRPPPALAHDRGVVVD